MITRSERRRYDRQIRLAGFGIGGQEKLKQSIMLIAGAGGLGSPMAMYLASAGVGTIRIVDDDHIKLSNLNRQLLYTIDDIGKNKADTAKEKLVTMNRSIRIEAVNATISSHNIRQLVEQCELILDATDNFRARYILNEAAIKTKIPFIYGGIYGFEGALTTIIPGKTPCLRCIFKNHRLSPETPPVLGVVPGAIGCLQALEAIKYATGIGRLLTNRLLIFNGISMKFSELKLKRDPDCSDCSGMTSSAEDAALG